MNTHSALSQMNRFRDELDRVFGADAMQWARPVAYPLVNIWEDENGFFVQAEVPGLTMEDLEIYIHEGDELTIKGVRKQTEIEGTWRRHERAFGEFERTFKLADVIDIEKVSAELKDGILKITLPKSEAVKPRKIKVKVA